MLWVRMLPAAALAAAVPAVPRVWASWVPQSIIFWGGYIITTGCWDPLVIFHLWKLRSAITNNLQNRINMLFNLNEMPSSKGGAIQCNELIPPMDGFTMVARKPENWERS